MCEWKNYHGYQVSDDGQVMGKYGRILKANPTGHGYYFYNLQIDGKSHPISAHKLVLTVFVGDRPDGMETRHLNDDKSDNRLCNLAYGTKQQNIQDAYRNGNGIYPNSKVSASDYATVTEIVCASPLASKVQIANAASLPVGWVGNIINRTELREYRRNARDLETLHIRTLYDLGWTQQAIADEFGYTYSGISRIVNYNRRDGKIDI